MADNCLTVVPGTKICTTSLLSGNETLKHLTGEKKDIIEEIFKKPSLQDLHGYIKYKLLLFSDELACIRPVNVMKRIL